MSHILLLPDVTVRNLFCRHGLVLPHYWPRTDDDMPVPVQLPLCHDGEDY
jgi:hypothetical protein